MTIELSNLSITNFRGVPNFELEFREKTPIYLIGSNNAGKSTILNSVALLLKSGGFHLFSPDIYDFYHNKDNEPSNAFCIKASLKVSTTVHGAVGKIEDIHFIDVKGNYYKTSGRIDHSHHLLGHDSKPIQLTLELSPSAKDLAAHPGAKDKHPFRKVNAKLRDIQKELPEVWLLNSKNLNKSLYDWKTGPLNKLSRILTDKFLNESWDFTYKGKTTTMPKGIENAYKYFSATIKDFPYWINDLKPKLESSLRKYLGRDTSISLNPLMQSIEEWLQQQIVLSFAAEEGQAITPLDKMGDGYQSLIRLSALEVLAELDECEKVILLYEEPETYLHPHLKRKLRDIFDKLAKKGWCILAATHSPEFISYEKEQSIYKLNRLGENFDYNNIITKDISDNVKLQEKLDEYGNHEIFFCQKVILCEGKDDLFSIKTYLEKSNIDLDSKSISILSCGSVGNIPDFVDIADKLGIPFCAITDLDKQEDQSIKPNTKAAREKISPKVKKVDIMLEWDNDLEDCLLTPLKQGSLIKRQKATPEWQNSNISRNTLEEIKDEKPKYSSLCESIIEWIQSIPNGENGSESNEL